MTPLLALFAGALGGLGCVLLFGGGVWGVCRLVLRAMGEVHEDIASFRARLDRRDGAKGAEMKRAKLEAGEPSKVEREVQELLQRSQLVQQQAAAAPAMAAVSKSQQQRRGARPVVPPETFAVPEEGD